MTIRDEILQVAENTPKKTLDIQDASGLALQASKGYMKKQTKAKKPYDQRSVFPMRFESREQKEEFRRAAQKRRQTLTAFLLTAGELLTKETLEQTA